MPVVKREDKHRERDMAAIVRTALIKSPAHEASMAELREYVEKRVKLTKADRAASKSRPGEEVWEQILRNLQSHITSHDGFAKIPGGLRLVSPSAAPVKAKPVKVKAKPVKVKAKAKAKVKAKAKAKTQPKTKAKRKPARKSAKGAEGRMVMNGFQHQHQRAA